MLWEQWSEIREKESDISLKVHFSGLSTEFPYVHTAVRAVTTHANTQSHSQYRWSIHYQAQLHRTECICRASETSLERSAGHASSHDKRPWHRKSPCAPTEQQLQHRCTLTLSCVIFTVLVNTKTVNMCKTELKGKTVHI